MFKTDTVFSNTASIELVVTEMSIPNNRVRIDYIQFGLGLEYDDEWILEANSKTSLSAINDDLPESEFSITLNNDEQIFNVDNPASEINFLESGQRMNVVMGYIQYELDYRGEPAIDCGDTIGQENKYDPDLKTIVEESQITFNAGLLGGGLITRRKECVART